MSINFHFICILFCLVALSSCLASSTPRSHIVANDNADFKEIELNSDLQNPCSPDISSQSDFIGIAINVPTDVEFDEAEPAQDGSFTIIPICGYYQLGMLELSKDSVIQLFAMNVETQQVYRGELIDEDAGTEEPMPFDEPVLQPQDLEGQLLSAYFNPNLSHYVELPVAEATYKILVQIGQVKSNIVEVNINQKVD